MVGSGCTGRHGTSGVLRIGKLLPAAIIIGAIWLLWHVIVAVFVWLPWWADSIVIYLLAWQLPAIVAIATGGKPRRRQSTIDEEQAQSHAAAFADLDRQRAELGAAEDELARREALLLRFQQERRDARLAERIGAQIKNAKEGQS
jgi:hypothetical protein